MCSGVDEELRMSLFQSEEKNFIFVFNKKNGYTSYFAIMDRVIFFLL